MGLPRARSISAGTPSSSESLSLPWVLPRGLSNSESLNVTGQNGHPVKNDHSGNRVGGEHYLSLYRQVQPRCREVTRTVAESAAA